MVNGELVCTNININEGEKIMVKEKTKGTASDIPILKDTASATSVITIKPLEPVAVEAEVVEVKIEVTDEISQVLQDARKEIIGLQKKVSVHLARENEAIKRENDSGKKVIENEGLIQQLKDRVTELEATIRTMAKNHMTALAKQKAAFEADNDTLTKKADKDKLEKRDLREKNLELRKSALEGQAYGEKFKKLMEQATADAKLFNDENIILSEKMDSLNTEVINRNSTIRSVRTDLSKSKDEIISLHDDYDMKLKEAATKLDEYRKRCIQEQKDLDKKYDGLKEKLDACKDILRDVEKNRKAAVYREKQLKKRIARYEVSFKD